MRQTAEHPFSNVGVKTVSQEKPLRFSFLLRFQRFQSRSLKYLSQSVAGWSSCFSDRREKHKLGRGHWDLAFCKVLLNSIKQSEEKSKISQPIRARAAILFFFHRPEKHKLVRGRWNHASFQVSLNCSGYRREVEKCEKFTTDRRWTTGERRTKRDHNSALEAQVH